MELGAAWRVTLSAAGKNLAVIVGEIERHNASCRFGPAIAVELHPIEIERLGWEDGDTVANCELRADPARQTGTFHIVCSNENGPTEHAQADVKAPAPGERVLV